MTDQNPRSTVTILAADMPEVRQIIRILLERDGYRVILSEPADARRVFESARARLDLVITNQPELFLDVSVPLIYISGAPDRQLLLEIEARRDALLRKPFTIRDLREAVQVALTRGESK